MKRLVAEGEKQVVRGRARAEALLRLIARKMQRIAEDFYDLGEALRELYRRRLFVSIGYDTFEAMLAGRNVMGRTQALKLIKIVEHMPRDVALGMTLEKAGALVTYTAATPEPDVPEGLVEADAIIDGKHLSELSGRALETAAKKVRAAKRRKRKKTPEQRAQAVAGRAAVAWLRRLLAEAGLGRVRVEVTRAEVTMRCSRAAAERAARGPSRS